jgi:NTE family protein
MLLALVMALATRTEAQKIGLALSGGAARGLAHIGVLKVLVEAGVPVDVVAGTSMGSVIGGLYAIGYTPAQLDSIVTSVNWPRLLTDPVDRRDLPVDRKYTEDHYLLTLPISRGSIKLPQSVVPGQRISQLLTRLTWSVHGVRDFHQLALPFTAVATNLETGTAEVLDRGYLPDAMRASMALPSVFAPVELDDSILIDGGVIRNLPAQDARALGADVLICSDVTDPLEPRDSLRSLADVLLQSVSFRIWDSQATQRAQCDVLIVPEVRGFSSTSFTRGRELIARGEAAARAALPRIDSILARLHRSRRDAARPPLVEPESVFVTKVRFDSAGLAGSGAGAGAGAGQMTPGFLGRVLGVRDGTWVTPRELDHRIDRLYATGLFQSVRYRLDPAPGGGGPAQRELIVFVRERTGGRFGLGLRYDSRYKASLLLSGAFGVPGFGSNAQLDARLGQQIRVGIGGSQTAGTGRPVVLGARVDYVRSPFDLYAAGHQVAEARVDLGAVTTSVSTNVGAGGLAAVRIKAEHAHWAESVSAIDSAPINRTFYTVAGVLEADTYDHGLYPRRGFGFRGVSEWGNRLVGDGTAFSHQLADLHLYVPVLPTVSVWAGATLGATGGTPPPHYLFSLGGARPYYLFPDRDIPFYGLNTQELRGRHLQKAELGVQWEFLPDWFGRVGWNAGTVLDHWTWAPAQWVDGVGVELGVRTFAGRLSLTATGNAKSQWPKLDLDLGYPF